MELTANNVEFLYFVLMVCITICITSMLKKKHIEKMAGLGYEQVIETYEDEDGDVISNILWKKVS